MVRKSLIERENLDIHIENWPMVNVECIPEKHREIYLKRKLAVDLYMTDKAKITEITKITGINKVDLFRLIKRCTDYDKDGTVYGYRALIPFKRMKDYDRNKPIDMEDKLEKVSFNGAFSKFLDEHPNIAKLVIKLYLNKSEGVKRPRMRIIDIHDKFVKACKNEGVTEEQYPLNTNNLGLRSLERFLKKLQNENFAETVFARFGVEAGRRARKLKPTNHNKNIITRPYQQVQFDGHKIDAIFTITYTTPLGHQIQEIIDRPWLLLLIDVATRTILGYHICLEKEYSSTDVLQCIKKAVIPWREKTFTIHGLHYPEQVGYASAIINEAKWAVWDELLFDNAKANLANIVKDRLKRVIGCDVNAGPVNMPEYRGIIERLFGLLEENGYHRLPSTTGSNPKDPRRQDPEDKARKYNISIEHLEELTEILIANYNLRPHSGIENFAPLGSLKQKLENGEVIRQLPEENRSEVVFLSFQAKRSVAGSVEYGKRPYIQFENVTYHNSVLSTSPWLINKELTLLVNVEDVRTIRAFLPDGSELGILKAHGHWGVIPHSLRLRKAIFKLKRDKKINFAADDNPFEIYIDYLSKSKDKNSRVKLAKLQHHNPEIYRSNRKETTTEQNLTSSEEKGSGVQHNPIIRKLKRTIVF
jgi:putative transposase